jgi:surface antigen bspA (fragment)
MKQLKRLTSVLLVLGMVLGLMPLSAFAAEPENAAGNTPMKVVDGENTYTYTLLGDGTVELTGFSTTAKEAYAVIPSTMDGHLVTSIGEVAFAGCTELTTVKLPDSIISIKEHAFLYCTGLTTVDLGNSVESIGASAFASCANMKKLTIPQSIKTIGDWAFSYANVSGYNEKIQLKVLHYTGTQAQWDALAEKCAFETTNPVLTDPEEFHCAHTVSFDCGDPAEGFSQEVQYGETVPRPTDPTADHYQFEDWYTEKTAINRSILARKLRKM